MKLKYRGIEYDYNPPQAELIESEIAGKYRGTPWKGYYLLKSPVPQPDVSLQYRGVPYRTSQTVTPIVEPDAAPAIARAAHAILAEHIALLKLRFHLPIGNP